MNICTCYGCRTGNGCIGEGSPIWRSGHDTIDAAHAEALLEDAAHDAAAAVAQPLTAEYLIRYADPIPPMPRRLRNQLQARSILALVVPRGRQA